MLNDKRTADEVAKAIEQAELNTRAELRAVVIDRSDSYRYIPLLWAAIASLFLPLFAAPYFALDVEMAFTLQVAGLVFLFFVLQIDRLRTLLVPKGVKRQRAHRMAMQQFIEQGVHLTQDNSGVLIFVSQAEHHVEIIADRGISQHVPNDVWGGIVDALIARIKAGQAAEGLVECVNTCGGLLAEHFPTDGTKENELDNQLVVLTFDA